MSRTYLISSTQEIYWLIILKDHDTLNTIAKYRSDERMFFQNGDKILVENNGKVLSYKNYIVKRNIIENQNGDRTYTLYVEEIE